MGNVSDESQREQDGTEVSVTIKDEASTASRSGEGIARLVRIAQSEDSIEVMVPGEHRLRLTHGEAELLHAQLELALGLVPVVQIPDDPEPREWP